MSKILMIVPRFPYPPTDGALLVISDRIKSFEKLGYEVVCFVVKKSQSNWDNSYLKKSNVIFSSWTQSNNVFIILIKMLRNGIPPLISFYFDWFVQKELEQIIRVNKFSYVTIDHLHLSHYGKLLKRKFPLTKFILFHHNIETDLYFSFYKNAPFYKKLYYFLNSKLTLLYEKSIYKYFDNNVFLSEKDLKRADCISNSNLEGDFIPLSVDINKYQYLPVENIGIDDIIKIGFIGSMDYLPNIEGVVWFIVKVIPLLEKSKIKYNLSIVGKNPPTRLFNVSEKYKNINITGWVEDDVKYYNEMNIIICPIFSGAGVKLKVLNALSCGKIIIATSKAVEGIEGIKQDIHYLKANSESEFFDKISMLCNKVSKVDYVSISKMANQFSLNNSVKSFNKLNEIFKL